MAFNPQRFCRVTLSDNTGQITLQDATVTNAPAYYTYCTASDTVAQVGAANYFASDYALYDLKPKDVICAVCSDANSFFQVVAVDTSAGTISTTPFTAAGTVDTADIVDGAVTNAKVNAAAAIAFSKLASLSSGNILVGSAGNVATSVAMSGDATISNTGAVSLAATTIKYAVVTMSAADWIGMYVTPKQLVAAPGANLQITVHRIMAFLDYGTTQFTGGGNVFAQYDSTTLGAGTAATGVIANTGINAAVADSTFQLSGTQAVAAASTTVNKGIYLTNASGAFATGDSTFKVAIWYSVGSFA